LPGIDPTGTTEEMKHEPKNEELNYLLTSINFEPTMLIEGAIINENKSDTQSDPVYSFHNS